MININNMSKKFDENLVLDRINLNVKKGQIIALIGASGSGKSTLLRCLNMLESPFQGTLEIDGLIVNFKNITRKEIQELRLKSAMVFQNYNLFANKNALSNITEALEITRKVPKKEAVQIAMQKLAQMGLENKASAYPHELSGGQQQRVAIARALALNTEVLLMDEPTSALDVALVAEVEEAIKSIKDKTMIIVTHELKFASQIADKFVFLSDGKITWHGKPDEFFGLKEHENQALNAFLKRI